MSSIIVVGSGPTGVHFALSALEQGHQVTMLDTGYERPPDVLPEASFDGIKDQLEDPAGYFLGDKGQSIVFPSPSASYYSFPPTKEYVFERPKSFVHRLDGFDPLISFAAGGLAQAWTGGSYPLSEYELSEFPFDYEELAPHYENIIRRIGVAATRDDLSKFSPWFEDYSESLLLDNLSQSLLTRYAAKRQNLNSKLHFHLGRSRVAVIAEDRENREACDYLGRCFWGCPKRALYEPLTTLAELRKMEGFRYVSNQLVTHFDYSENRLTGCNTLMPDGSVREFVADIFVLAAGTLSSSKIFLDTIFKHTGNVETLTGLMDNRQFMIPFVHWPSIGRNVVTDSYQYHHLALMIGTASSDENVHGQLTALKAAAIHPILQSLKVDFGSARKIFSSIHSGLGAVNLWFHDRRRDHNYITISPSASSGVTELAIHYRAKESAEYKKQIDVVRRALGKLGCSVPKMMIKDLTPGASVHYAGTLPMSRAQSRFACDERCRSYDFSNLYIADGSTFPFLPAKNLTFSLMANAARVANELD